MCYDGAMARKPNPIPSTRKSVTLPNVLWEAIAEFREANGIPTEAEALRRMLEQFVRDNKRKAPKP